MSTEKPEPGPDDLWRHLLAVLGLATGAALAVPFILVLLGIALAALGVGVLIVCMLWVVWWPGGFFAGIILATLVIGGIMSILRNDN
ncbi:hypothetical protein OG552_10785 [Streptomyces sp. NBC_01476]|uniref:hypothetical protein n=1 Tax=Streptomyces sp. NBC_01476 TaxID=2903881 RepID=UPI002E35C107|nr:hypothetical protein [Streptomyces sp. NBC_01476]